MESKLFIIKKSSISGKGVFASQDLEKDLELGVAFTKISNTGDPDKDYSRTDLGAFVNHSKDANIVLNQKKKEFVYITKRDMKKGEELLIDYRSFPWEGEREFAY